MSSAVTMVTEAGASVTFCRNFEAPKTVSILTLIKSSILIWAMSGLSESFGGIGLLVCACASIRTVPMARTTRDISARRPAGRSSNDLLTRNLRSRRLIEPLDFRTEMGQAWRNGQPAYRVGGLLHGNVSPADRGLGAGYCGERAADGPGGGSFLKVAGVLRDNGPFKWRHTFARLIVC